jgi:hypothetical protein
VESDPSAESPIVKGHPKDYAPAVGWVSRLKRRGDKLLAQAKFISDDIIDELKSGFYRNVSVSLSPDLALRHVALLGAAKPAVKGLEPMKYSDFSQSDESGSEEKAITESSANDNIRKLSEKIKDSARELTPAQEKMIAELLESIANSVTDKHKLLEILENFLRTIPEKNIFSEFATGSDSRKYATGFEYTNVDPIRLDTHIAANKLALEDNLSYEEALNIIYLKNQ